MSALKKCLLTIIICFIVLICIWKAADKYKNIEPQNSVSESNETVYTIKDYNGKIAVFTNSSDTPIKVYETPLTSELPISDRKRLLSGILAYSEKELTLLLQDYDI